MAGNTEKNTSVDELELLKEQLAEKEKALEALMASSEKAKADASDLRRRVSVRIESGIGRREPVVVRVNDYVATIKRGVSVEVPYFVALAIQESQDEDVRTNLRIQELVDKYEAEKPK